MDKTRRLTLGHVALCLSAIGLTGCQSFTGSSNTAQIRIIDSSPDAQKLDIYQGSSALSYNLTFGNITSYIPVTPGSADLSTSISGSHQTIARTHETLAGGQYTLLVGNAVAGLQQLLLKDQSTPAPPGQAALRFITQVTALTAFDVYLVPTGVPVASVSPILVNQSFGANSGYLNVPAGSYRFVLYPTGTPPSTALPAAYSGPTVAYTSGTARTIILLDQRIPLRPYVQMVIATDVDATSVSN